MRALLQRLALQFGRAAFTSQKGQDRWVIQEVLRWKRRGFFLDLAAADGITHSNTFALEKWFGWSGLCIEPNPGFFADLQSRRRCRLDQSVISNKHERLQFRIDNGQLGGVVADDTDNNPRTRGEQLSKASILEVDAYPLNDVLERHQAPRIIDYFSLDVEGCEERIIAALDFKKYQFRCLTIERPTPRVNEILFENGYLFVKNHCFDSFYIHPSVQGSRPILCEPFEQVPPKDW